MTFNVHNTLAVYVQLKCTSKLVVTIIFISFVRMKRLRLTTEEEEQKPSRTHSTQLSVFQLSFIRSEPFERELQSLLVFMPADVVDLICSYRKLWGVDPSDPDDLECLQLSSGILHAPGFENCVFTNICHICPKTGVSWSTRTAGLPGTASPKTPILTTDEKGQMTYRRPWWPSTRKSFRVQGCKLPDGSRGFKLIRDKNGHEEVLFVGVDVLCPQGWHFYYTHGSLERATYASADWLSSTRFSRSNDSHEDYDEKGQLISRYVICAPDPLGDWERTFDLQGGHLYQTTPGKHVEIRWNAKAPRGYDFCIPYLDYRIVSKTNEDGTNVKYLYRNWEGKDYLRNWTHIVNNRKALGESLENTPTDDVFNPVLPQHYWDWDGNPDYQAAIERTEESVFDCSELEHFRLLISQFRAALTDRSLHMAAIARSC
jgi:hypothetical protein